MSAGGARGADDRPGPAETLDEARERAQRYLDLTSTIMVGLDLDGRVTMCNHRVEEVLGYCEVELLGERWLELVHHGADRALIEDVFRALLEDGEFAAHRYETTLTAQDGQPHVVAAHSVSWCDAAGNVVGTLTSAEDISERRAAEAALAAEHARALRYLDMAAALIVALDRGGRITLVNQNVCAVLGYTEDELIGRDWLELAVPPDERGAVRAVFERLIGGELGPVESYENGILTRAGERRTILWRNSVDRNERGTVVATLSAGEDVTERRRAEREIAHLAYHDPLTGLANRVLFEQHLERAVAAARRSGESVALLSLDLDRFKLVNDTLGHAAGDRLLEMVATRLGPLTRESDLLARQGGDEFMLMLTGLERDPQAAANVVARKLEQAMAAPFAIGGAEFRIGVTIGISLFPADAGHAEDMLKHADSAMYQAKAAGRGRSLHYVPGGDESRDRLWLTSRLRSAIADGRFVLHYQPIVRLADNTLEGVEALLRWDDPDDGLLEPDAFLGLAEDTGLMQPIGEWVIAEVCRQAREWRRAGLAPTVAFNLSPRQLRGRGAAMALQRELEENHVPAEAIVVELTESAVMADAGASRKTLDGLRSLGVRLAIDDFGSGYSSLGRLRALGVDQLKIDRVFMCDVPQDPAAATIVRTIVGLALGLGMTAVGEGVETDAQRAVLRAGGCPLAQGFHLGRPMPADAATALMRAGVAAPTA